MDYQLVGNNIVGNVENYEIQNEVDDDDTSKVVVENHNDEIFDSLLD